MLQPKRTKYRKAHKGRIHGAAKGGTALNFGAYGLKAIEPGRITARQIEAARRADHAPPQARRAGSGSASSRTCRCRASRPRCAWAAARARRNSGSCRVKPGRIMFELDGVPRDIAREAFALAAAKLPIKTRFVTRLGEEALSDEDPRTSAPRRPDQLKGELTTLKKEAFNLRFQRASGQLENTARVRQVRRDIARIKTILERAARRGVVGGRRNAEAHPARHRGQRQDATRR